MFPWTHVPLYYLISLFVLEGASWHPHLCQSPVPEQHRSCGWQRDLGTALLAASWLLQPLVPSLCSDEGCAYSSVSRVKAGSFYSLPVPALSAHPHRHLIAVCTLPACKTWAGQL